MRSGSKLAGRKQFSIDPTGARLVVYLHLLELGVFEFVMAEGSGAAAHNGFSVVENQALETSLALMPTNAAELESICCAGCSRAAVSHLASDFDAVCLAGCRCLMCPKWYACPECADAQAQAHRASQLNHITYYVLPQQETAARESWKLLVPIKPMAIASQAFVFPLCRMVLPVLALWIQVRRSLSILND